jgi:hypothetical protein
MPFPCEDNEGNDEKGNGGKEYGQVLYLRLGGSDVIPALAFHFSSRLLELSLLLIDNGVDACVSLRLNGSDSAVLFGGQSTALADELALVVDDDLGDFFVHLFPFLGELVLKSFLSLSSFFFGFPSRFQLDFLQVFPLDVDNVTFALNIAGKLLGEKEMMAIRNRRRAHAPLEDLEKIKLEAGWKAEEEGRKAQEAFKDKLSQKRKEMNKEIAKVIIDDQGQLISKSGTLTTEQNRRIRTIETQGNAGIDTIIYQEQRKLKQATREVKRKRRNDIGASQSQIKNLAVFLPPIPLLIVAFIVFARKRHREMEGTATSRIRGE